MTVYELACALLSMPADARVVLEGCDCMGLATGVELDEYRLLVIRRKDGSGYPGIDALPHGEQCALTGADPHA